MKRSREVLIGDVLKEFFERPYIAARVAEGRIADTWREVVGDQVADMTRELRLDGRILHVCIESGLLRQELFYQRDALRDALNERSKANIISAVIIR